MLVFQAFKLIKYLYFKHALVSKTIKQLVMAKEIVVTLRMGMEHANVM